MHLFLRAGVAVFAAVPIALATTAFAVGQPGPQAQTRGALEALLRAPGPAGPVQAGLVGTGFRPAVPRREKEPARPRYAFPLEGPARYGEAMARFGSNRGSHVHQGQDVFAPAGTPLVAVSDALVVETGSGDGRGNFVALYDARAGRTYVYFHMQSAARVDAGERVRAGQRLGRVGCTGSCWGDHLHFEVRRGRTSAGAAVDPLPLLRRWAD